MRLYTIHWGHGGYQPSEVLGVSRATAREAAERIYAGTLTRRGGVARVEPVNPTPAERRMAAQA
jgi:DNA-binding FadR family transcriptional regulator